MAYYPSAPNKLSPRELTVCLLAVLALGGISTPSAQATEISLGFGEDQKLESLENATFRVSGNWEVDYTADGLRLSPKQEGESGRFFLFFDLPDLKAESGNSFDMRAEVIIREFPSEKDATILLESFREGGNRRVRNALRFQETRRDTEPQPMLQLDARGTEHGHPTYPRNWIRLPAALGATELEGKRIALSLSVLNDGENLLFSSMLEIEGEIPLSAEYSVPVHDFSGQQFGLSLHGQGVWELKKLEIRKN